jgi:hypothetical protein
MVVSSPLLSGHVDQVPEKERVTDKHALRCFFMVSSGTDTNIVKRIGTSEQLFYVGPDLTFACSGLRFVAAVHTRESIKQRDLMLLSPTHSPTIATRPYFKSNVP